MDVKKFYFSSDDIDRKSIDKVPSVTFIILVVAVLFLGMFFGFLSKKYAVDFNLFKFNQIIALDQLTYTKLAISFLVTAFIFFILYINITYKESMLRLTERLNRSKGESRKRLLKLYEIAPSGVVIQNNEGIILHANKAAGEILGISNKKMIGKTFLELLGNTIDENSLPFTLISHPLMKSFRKGEPIHRLVLGFLRKKDKSHRWIVLKSEPIRDSTNGQIKKVMTTFVDNTESKVNKDLLRVHSQELAQIRAKEAKERARHTALLTSIGDGMVVTNWEGVIIFINNQAQKMLRLRSQEAIGKFLHEFVGMEDEKGNVITPAKQPINQTLSSGRKFENKTYFFIRRDKSKFPAAITTSPVILENKTIGVIMLFRDITKQKEIDRMKTEFISLASHQLRTPLSAMKWFLEMLLSGDAGRLNSEQQEFVENVNQSNERMISLVNSLLNISRIESGRLIVEPKPTNLGKLVKDVVKELKVKFKEREQIPIISVHDRLPPINIDPKLIRHVYMNLLTNASKYSPQKSHITIFVSRKGDKVISQVSDEGCGIPEDEQDKVFRKFYRGKNVRKIETEGTGLGLYLVKAIVEASGGEIWFKSEEGKGTTFWFSLPLSGTKPRKGDVSLDI